MTQAPALTLAMLKDGVETRGEGAVGSSQGGEEARGQARGQPGEAAGRGAAQGSSQVGGQPGGGERPAPSDSLGPLIRAHSGCPLCPQRLPEMGQDLDTGNWSWR